MTIKDRIETLLEKGTPFTVSEVARQLKIRREYVGGYMKCLEDMGILKGFKVGRALVYKK